MDEKEKKHTYKTFREAVKGDPRVLHSGQNQKVSTQECDKIRRLDNFDLMMLISEIHDHGWNIARKTLAMMPG